MQNKIKDALLQIILIIPYIISSIFVFYAVKSKVKSRLLCKMLYNVFTISTYQN